MPVLAESWEANADESVWTFRLRDGVTFQDGRRSMPSRPGRRSNAC